MSELNMPVENATATTAVDTNAEYILPAEEKKQPPVLLSVSRSIIVETVKDFFGSIIGFFWRYIKHFMRCLVFFISPSLKKKPFKDLDFKENSQHAFEFVLIVMALLVFMIKMNWIPPSAKNLLEIYGNDISQKALELFLFVILAVGYLSFAGLSILFGRLFRMLFKIKIEKDESDILQVYLNNAFFSFAAVIALIIRSVASFETYDSDSISQTLLMIIVPVVGIPILVWSIRYAILQKMKFIKGALFFLLSVSVYGLFYMFSCLIISAFVIGI